MKSTLAKYLATIILSVFLTLVILWDANSGAVIASITVGVLITFAWPEED